MRAVTVSAALAFTIVPSVAWAQDQGVIAEGLFSEGLNAMKQERWAAACDAFAASEKAEASAGTEINLGVCNEKQKKYATAITWYDKALRSATEGGRPDKAKIAKSELDRVMPLAHKLHVVAAKPADGAGVKRNGASPVDLAGLMAADTNIDPGKYSFELVAKGKKPITKELTIPETPGKTTLDFPAMEDAPVDQAGPSGPGDTGGGSTIVVNDGSGQRTVAIIVGGVGVLAVVAAIVIEVVALNEQSESEKQQRIATDANTPQADRQQHQESAESHHKAAKNNELIAIGTGIGGIVLVGVGAVLFFTAPKHASSGKPRVLPALGPGYAGASLGFTF